MKEIFKSNVIIIFEKLQQSISEYLVSKNNTDMMYIHAYLPATLNAIIQYIECFMELEEDMEILACRGVNNTLKHNAHLFEPYTEAEYGFAFPATFPISFDPIEIIWKNVDLVCKHEDQKKAFAQLFVGKSVLQTLQGIVERIKNN